MSGKLKIHDDQKRSDLPPTMGDASSVIFLLRDYSGFGLAERICYHFDLTSAIKSETTPVDSKVTHDSASSNADVGLTKKSNSKEFHRGLHNGSTSTCGVLRVLELAPLGVSHRLSKRQKRFLRMRLREFNATAEKVHTEGTTICYQPKDLPLRCNPSTKVSFAYEKTRIAFCVDASASLTSIFGVNGNRPSGNGNIFCPLDRLPEMARIFFSSLIEPIGNTSASKSWAPLISVTVLAVYPMGKISETNLLVRDFLVHDAESANLLIDQIDNWTHSEVESGISERLSRRQASNTWSIPIYSSNLQHILEAADYTLDILSSEARPVIVVATDCRSISCEGTVDVFLDVDLLDIPIHVLDLSLKETHTMEDEGDVSLSEHQINFLTYDPGGNMGFPLYLTDDSEALFVVCRASGGCFLDFSLLSESAKSPAAQQQLQDELVEQSYSFRRKFMKMNGLQWLVLFSLSPISPTFNSSWGKLLPPSYLQKQLSKSMMEVAASATETLQFHRHQGIIRQVVANESFQRSGSEGTTATPGRRQHIQAQTTFSTYVVSPLRIKALILTRVKEGYRAKQYGSSTHDPDKVLILFTLPLESGTMLHYELSYKALSSENRLVGSAHIKIELSGNPRFIQAIKDDFFHQSLQVKEQRSRTIREKQIERLCEVIRGIRRGDILQSYLNPPQKWDGILATSDSPFVKRLGTLKGVERKRHFQVDQFDVVCSGTIPYGLDDRFLSGFMTNEDGKQELIDSISDWSCLKMTNNLKFLKRSSTFGQMTNYCVVEILDCSKASQLFTICVEFFGGTDPINRFQTLSSLKETLNGLKNVEVLEKQIARFLIENEYSSSPKNVEIQFHHGSWDLVKDSELLSLLSKRRTEIGAFRLLESRDDYALFAKLAPKTSSSPGNLVQYEVAVHDDKVIIDLHMESESGIFNPYFSEGGKMIQFNRMLNTIRRRDQECGRALRSRTTLLRRVDEKVDEMRTEENDQLCVKRLLAYSSRVTRNLRYFRSFGEINAILVHLTCELLVSKKFGVKSARLQIDPETLICEEQRGVWFTIQHDRQTMSMIHLSLVNNLKDSESVPTFRELTFFTIGISDLYSKRDDLADDDSVESHFSEYLCVSDYADRFELEQAKNFTLAAYLALRQTSTPEVLSMHPSDFMEVIESLDFVEVNSFVVTGTPTNKTGSNSKLLRSLRAILSPVPGNSYYFYYSGQSKFEITEVLENEAGESSDDDSNNSNEASGWGNVIASKIGDYALSKDEHLTEENDNRNFQDYLYPPIFVRFSLDGKTASSVDLNKISDSSVLTVLVSVFKSSDVSPLSPKLPISHQAFALKIATLLKSYIAEQTLERLRKTNFTEGDLQLVRKCMAKITNVVSFMIEIYFFISRRDMMMPAGAPAGGEAEVEEGLHVLETELMNNNYFTLKPLADDVYFLSLSNMVGEVASQQVWCLLKLQRSNGTVSSQLYHPDGETAGMKVLSLIHGIICSCINIANQQLLLRSMHRTRAVSELLIPKQAKQSVETNITESKTSGGEKFAPGIFSCPIVFRELFRLYHRAATNPGQVARTLEATVLHNFAVSNMPGIFVYKDETGAIFYMKIEPRGSGIDSDGQVELLVYGIKKPGPSVTEQLSVLLKRRLLLIGVDMLSSVLTKNPHFKWKQADFLFLSSFDCEWKKLESKETDDKNFCYYFKFPDEVCDPSMVLLLFRQNLCGSTFFHRLNDISKDGSTPSPTIEISEMLTSGGTGLKMNGHDFSLYFNNAPSKLDPAFQGLNTLTDKGADYCRKSGTGIAIVEFTLMNGNGSSADDLYFAEPPTSMSKTSRFPSSKARMEIFDEIPPNLSTESVYMRIKITDTAMNRDVFKKWLQLTLNQALVGWVAERMFERLYFEWRMPIVGTKIQQFDITPNMTVDTLCSGLLAVKSIFESCYDLPHPCIAKFETSGVIRSSSVATLTLDLLENCILAPIVENKMISLTESDHNSKRLLSEVLSANLQIIRFSRSEKPRMARIEWQASGRKKAVVSILSKNKCTRSVEDSPVDCPEYTCFFTISERDRTIKCIDGQLRLYREVVIHDGISEKSESIKILQSVKRKNPAAFIRSFGFILSVKRNTRRLWTYNWNPKLVKSVKMKFQEVDASNLSDTRRASYVKQRRSLGNLSPGFAEGIQKKRIQPIVNQPAQDKKINAKVETSTTGPSRRIRRPTMIRRPKLIGKSVEGAAMQAMAASRKRASTNQFKNKTNPSTGTTRAQLKRDSTTRRANTVGKTESNLTKTQTRVPRSVQVEKTDDTLIWVLNDFLSLCSSIRGQMERSNFTQNKARQILADIWWPQNASQTIPQSVAEFFTFLAPNAWSDICDLPPLPGGILDIFIPTLARWTVAIKPGVELLSVSSKTNKRIDSILMCTKIRNIRGTKCCVMVRISIRNPDVTQQRRPLVSSEGWVLNLRRRPKSSKRNRQQAKMRSSYFTEKDSAGMDKFLIDVHQSLILESLLFDFSASVVERAVRLLDERIDFDDLVPIVQELIHRYPYERQKLMPFLNYRAFEAIIVLKSYRDRLIDMFDASTLFERLCVEAEDREMLQFGSALCLKSISVKGSHSMCFITLYPNEKGKMKLVILTRTQGLDLADLMFREGSNVAIHVLDNIAIEGSRLALKELHHVAECLLKDTLWKFFSSKLPRTQKSASNKLPQQHNLSELLRLVPAHPFLQLPLKSSSSTDRIPAEVNFLFGKESGIDWQTCCASMRQNIFFSPHSSMDINGLTNNIFYIQRYDVLLIIVVKEDSSLDRIDVIEKKLFPDKYHSIFDSVVTFVLQYVWHNL